MAKFVCKYMIMRTLLVLLLLGSWTLGLSQATEFNDYRRKNESFGRVIDKEIRSDLACFTIGGIDESLGKTPLKSLPIKRWEDNYISYDSNGIQVTVKGAPFVPGKHKMSYEDKWLVKIDNKPYYGNYGRLPNTRVESVIVQIGKDTVPFPTSAIADLYNPNLVFRDASGTDRVQDAVLLSRDKRKIYIYMLSKDDRGSYEVTWIIQDKKYLRRVLDYGFSH